MDLLLLFAAGSATAAATGLGALPVAWLGRRAHDFRPLMWSLTIGLMGVASIVGLLLPALDEGSAASVWGGFAAGAAFLLVTKRELDKRDVEVAGIRGAGIRRALLVFLVLFVHSVPEGFAIGTAYASDSAGLSLFVILAIALQNVPEGTSVAIPMDAAGFSAGRQVWAAVLTSAPQPVGAVGAYVLVEQVEPLLPVSFGFAAGAMLAILASELVPDALVRGRRLQSLAGVVAGAALMLALAAAVGV
ncbi:MAG TPA: ZIP family metal transporter [Thermoleophilaceae bacterium]|jgi:ZIP family zinc transporter